MAEWPLVDLGAPDPEPYKTDPKGRPVPLACPGKETPDGMTEVQGEEEAISVEASSTPIASGVVEASGMVGASAVA